MTKKNVLIKVSAHFLSEICNKITLSFGSVIALCYALWTLVMEFIDSLPDKTAFCRLPLVVSFICFWTL